MTYSQQPMAGINECKARLFSSTLVGYLAGTLAALLDIKQATPSLRGAFEIAIMTLQAVGKLGFTGAVIGLIIGGLTWVSRSTSGRLKRNQDVLFSFFLTILSSPGLIYISYKLFKGGYMSKLPAATFLSILAALAIIALFFVAIRLSLVFVAWSDSGRLNRAQTVLIVLSIALAALLARWLDANLYRRLYIYLHCALGVVTVGGLALATRIALGSKVPSAVSKKVAFLFASLITVVFAVSLLTSNARQTVKAATFENTATLADLGNLTSFITNPSRATKGQSKAARLARKNRFRQMQIASSGDWPVFPGSHVLLISVDALRADRLGVYGYKTRDLTPKIDAWARKEAVIFERAYAAAPHSSYSISSLLTSRFTHDEAMFDKNIEHATIAEIVKDKGYITVARYTQGIFFTEGDAVGHYRRTKFGFEKAVHGGLRPDKLTEKAIEDIDQISANGEEPSLIWIHYFNVHEPYESTHFGTSSSDRYESEIYETDSQIARLIDHAKKKFDRNVIVFLTSDHGEEFKDHGGYYHGYSLYEEQVRVPFIVSFPGIEPNRIKTPISTAAFAPTALHLIGMEPPANMLGQDLRPAIFKGEKAHIAEPVVASVLHNHMLVRWPWKLIVDPSKGLFELYNLETDPLERANRYDTKKALAEELQGELNAWRDQLGRGENEVRTAINLGHMRDPRAVKTLMDVASNTGAPTPERVESINLLGNMKAESAKPILVQLLGDNEDQVAVASALTLGELGDASGTDIMLDALFDDDPGIRDRAGLILGRMGEKAAIPALVEALGRDNVSIREQAIRMLGRLGDPSTVEPLLDAILEDRTKYLVVLALGKIGDERAYDPLVNVLDNDRFTDVRGYAVVALGWLGLSKAIPRLIRALREEPEIKWTPESLIRLGAVGVAPLFGTDVAGEMATLGPEFGECVEKPRIVHGEFMDRTTCKTTGNQASLKFFADSKDGATVILRARHLLDDAGLSIPLKIHVNGTFIGEAELLGQFHEARINTEAGTWPPGEHTVTLKLEAENATFEMDHLLVLANQ